MNALPSRAPRCGWSRPAGLLLAVMAGMTVTLPADQPPAWLVPLLTAPVPPAALENAAVVLDEEATFHYLPGGRVRETFRQAIRVLSGDGIRMALPVQPYNGDTDRILKVQAWVVSPDQHHTDEYGRSDFVSVMADVDNNIWTNGRVVALGKTNQLQVGAVVAAEFDIERQTGMHDASWSFLRPLPVVRSAFEVVPLPGNQLVYHASSPTIPAPVAGIVGLLA